MKPSEKLRCNSATKERNTREIEEHCGSEYKDILSSLLKINSGNTDSNNYTDLVMQAIEATSTIVALKNSRDSNTNLSSDNTSKSSVKQKAGKKGQIVDCECDDSIEHKGNNSNADNVLRLLKQIKGNLTIDSKGIDEVIAPNCNDMNKEEVAMLLSKLRNNGKGNKQQNIVEALTTCLGEDNSNPRELPAQEDFGNSVTDRKKKLTSSRMSDVR